MTLADGSYRLGPASGELLVKTSRTGLGARAGHDLTVEATEWSGDVTVVAGDVARSSVVLEVTVGSLRVRSGSGGIKPLTDADRADIENTVRTKILSTDRFPTIFFRSTQVTGSPGSLTIDGDLTIMDGTHPVTTQVSVDEDGRVRGSATVVQTRWGIKPYSAFLGALKLADEVTIELDAVLAPA